MYNSVTAYYGRVYIPNPLVPVLQSREDFITKYITIGALHLTVEKYNKDRSIWSSAMTSNAPEIDMIENILYRYKGVHDPKLQIESVDKVLLYHIILLNKENRMSSPHAPLRNRDRAIDFLLTYLR